ncbi:MAG TPA: response regulator transcription factor [Parapedobacter sp.]|uniref:response regulator transcription factor n=1 Tax=Parapedobacter sp. TaxID=1958893 RepID=UPI002BC02110|nr:response regulator transcription factor [Parapedobacter sp.]HWK58659.1 response regulator transcription factor [Parapedobacter sp.]
MGSNLANVKHNIFLTYCHEVVGVAMKWLVKQHFPMSAIGEAQNFQETLSDLPKKNYDLVVLDAEIADNTHLLGAVQHIKSVSPLTRILIFSELDEAVYGPKYLAFGTNGFLAKNADVDDIVLAIETALSGGVFYGERDKGEPASRQQATMPEMAHRLSSRECQIADLLVKGTSLSQIGKLTNLKETTISTYKKRIFQKVGVKTLSDLIAVWEIYK